MRTELTILMSTLLLGACRASDRTPSGGSPPADEVWLADAQARAMNLDIDVVKLEDVDETVMSVGPVLSPNECAVRDAGAREACVVAPFDQGALSKIHLGTPATARTTEAVHDSFSGSVGWVAGTLDHSGRTVNVESVFSDPMAELTVGRQLRVELSVGTRPAFAVKRSAVVRRGLETFVFAPGATLSDGRLRFQRVPVRVDEDGSNPWIPVSGLEPGRAVVTRGAEGLAATLAMTAL